MFPQSGASSCGDIEVGMNWTHHMSFPLSKDASNERRLSERPVLRMIALVGIVGTLALLITALGFTVYAPARPDTLQLKAPAGPTVKILDPEEVVVVAPGDLSEDLTVSGEVKPASQVTVSAEVTGVATAVMILPGERVSSGDRLLTIADADFRLALRAEEATLASLKAQLRAATANLDRTSGLAGLGIKPKSALEEIESSVATLRANIDASTARIDLARTNLERATLRAPISGIVASRSIETGQLVQAGKPLFDIVDLSKVTVEARVPLGKLAALQPGQTAELWLPQDPERVFPARVARVSPRAEPGSRSAIVYLDADNAEGALRGSMFLMGRIHLRSSLDAVALPKDAVTVGSRSTSVHLVRGDRIVEAPVVIGARWNAGSAIEVTQGLSSGDVVLARPLRGLRPGDAIRIERN